ncbi:hypothetical protein D1872_354150 [compost metagenome]
MLECKETCTIHERNINAVFHIETACVFAKPLSDDLAQNVKRSFMFYRIAKHGIR